MKIINQQLKWIEETNECMLVTKYESGAIQVEPLTSEEASEWQSRIGY